MKKIFTLAVALCGMFTLSGCIMDETLDELIPEEYSPLAEIWESFTFKSLSGNADLVVENTSGDDGILSISTSNYSEDFLAVAVYKSDCEASKAQASYFDKLAGEFQPKMFGMDYAIILLDVYEGSADKDITWAKNLANVDAYSNVSTACIGGACQKVFLPRFAEATPGTVYFINKQNLARSRKAITWNTTDDQEELYMSLRTKLAEYLDLDEITFNPSVGGWNEKPQDVQL